MSDTTRHSLAILQRIGEFLRELPEDQVADLAGGKARLAVIPFGASRPLPPRAKTSPRREPARPPAAPSSDVTEHVQRLGQLISRGDGETYLRGLKKDVLKDVAISLGMGGISKYTKEELVDEIVDRTIGNRVDSLAIRGFEGVRP